MRKELKRRFCSPCAFPAVSPEPDISNRYRGSARMNLTLIPISEDGAITELNGEPDSGS